MKQPATSKEQNRRLHQLRVGESAVVCGISGESAMRRRLMDLGLIEGCRVECVGKSPAGDPSAYLICGALIAIRSENGRDVFIRPDGAQPILIGKDE